MLGTRITDGEDQIVVLPEEIQIAGDGVMLTKNSHFVIVEPVKPAPDRPIANGATA